MSERAPDGAADAAALEAKIARAARTRSVTPPPQDALFVAALPRVLGELQLALREEGLLGWLLYDHRGQSPLVPRVLGFDAAGTVPAGRYFYWVPALDMPALVVHDADAEGLPALPGDVLTYSTYAELRQRLEKLLPNRGALAMEHSPVAAVPDLSRVDAGTLELVRGIGTGGSLEVRSSMGLVNRFFGPWSAHERALHRRAQELLTSVRSCALAALAAPRVRESEVGLEAQQALSRAGLRGPAPHVTFGAHTRRRVHAPVGEDDRVLAPGELVSIELTGQLPGGPFAHLGVTAARGPSPRLSRLFESVLGAKARALALLAERFSASASSSSPAGARTLGYEVDRAMKDALPKGARVLGRGGHHLGFVPWSSEAATFDDTEIHDTRELVDGTAWALHPTLVDGEVAVRTRASVRRAGSTLEVLDAGQVELLEIG